MLMKEWPRVCVRKPSQGLWKEAGQRRAETTAEGSQRKQGQRWALTTAEGSQRKRGAKVGSDYCRSIWNALPATSVSPALLLGISANPCFWPP